METSNILKQFGIELPAKPFGNGHINSTFQVGNPPKYVLQKINTSVFSDPDGLMENIMSVTSFLRARIAEEGGDPERETLTFLPTIDGNHYYRDEAGNAWRVYRFIGDARSYESATPALFADSARAFARFQRMLSSFPADTLHETIPLFHDTGARLRQLKEAISENRSGRAHLAQAEIDFALSRKSVTGVITESIRKGDIPLRVTHNDTKLNNVLFDDLTGKALCVIDLDTVMPGSLLYDFGDAIRFGASTAAEDETDLSKVHFDLNLFRVYTEAYLEVLSDRITSRETDLLVTGAKLITLEIGMRFLADFLNGDVYFRTTRELHNLDRARTQFKLVSEMEQSEGLMNRVVRTICQSI